MRTFVILAILLVLAAFSYVSFLFFGRMREERGEVARGQLSRDNAVAGYRSNFTYDGHLFILLQSVDHSQGPQSMIHHPDCACLRRYRVPDPSILEKINGRQYIPYGKHIEDGVYRNADPVER